MRSVYDTVICLRGSHTVAWSLCIYLLHFAKAKLIWLCLRSAEVLRQIPVTHMFRCMFFLCV